MRTHPVFLRLEGRRCVIVGGDAPAVAKARGCAEAGAEVTVVAPEVGADLASTRDPELIRRLTDEAQRERVLLNVIDVPDACTFIAPAVVRRGDLQIAIGTGGASPGLAARLRRELEARLGPEWAPFVAILGGVRAALAGDPARTEVVRKLLASPLLELVRQGRYPEVDALLAREAGAGCTLVRLGVALGGEG